MKKSAIILTISILLLNVFSARATLAGNLYMTDEQNVKLARNKVMLRALKGRDADDYFETNPNENVRNGLDSADCGAVDIGNAAQPGFGGPKEINIIITGDVINANNRCK